MKINIQVKKEDPDSSFNLTMLNCSVRSIKKLHQTQWTQDERDTFSIQEVLVQGLVSYGLWAIFTHLPGFGLFIYFLF